MNHLIYSMTSTDPAPATGGDTKSWFEYYKWDVDGHAYIPFPEAELIGIEANVPSTLWFIMDGVLLGCVPVDGFMPCLQADVVELHYDTRAMQVAPTEVPERRLNWATGRAGDTNLMEVLKRSFDAQYPPRGAATESLQSDSV